jgi:hypothetical protein
MGEDDQLDLSAGTGYDAGSGSEGATGGNPAWGELLSALPQEYHEKVTPVLTKWDQGVQKRFETVQSEWEPWKKYKDTYKPEEIDWGLSLAQSLANDPKATYEAIGEYLKNTVGVDVSSSSTANPSGQGQQEPTAVPDPVAQELATYKQQLDLVSRAILAKEQQDREAAAERQLDLELNAAKDKYGEYDERFVLARLQAGDSVDQAVQAYHAIAEEAAKRARPRFQFLGAGGGVPATPIDTRKMSDKDRNQLALEYLQAARAEMD